MQRCKSNAMIWPERYDWHTTYRPRNGTWHTLRAIFWDPKPGHEWDGTENRQHHEAWLTASTDRSQKCMIYKQSEKKMNFRDQQR